MGVNTVITRDSRESRVHFALTFEPFGRMLILEIIFRNASQRSSDLPSNRNNPRDFAEKSPLTPMQHAET
jgi:hypothetical protein